MTTYHRSREEKIREKAETEGPILDLSNVYLGDDGCADVSRILRQYPSKKVLDLRGNRIQADGTAILAGMIKSTVTLVHLNLEWNCIGVLDHGIEQLSNALALNTSLVHLDLRNNNIGPDGAVYLANALKRNRTLEELDLRWNEIGSVGGNAFLDMLHENDILQHLQLMGNNVPISCSDSIEHLLKRNTHRQHHTPQVDTDDDIASNNSDIIHVHNVHDEDPRILLDVLAEKEKLTNEVDEMKRRMHAINNIVENHESTISQLRREVQIAEDDRDRFQRRETQERQHVADITALLEQSESRRKHDMDEHDRQAKSFEQSILVLKEEKFQLERAHQRQMDEIDQLRKEASQDMRLLESENSKLRGQISAAQDESARLREQLHEERKELDRREKNWLLETEEIKQAHVRRSEMTLQAIEQQLRQVTTQFETAHAELQTQKQANDALQSQILQLRVTHEAKLGEIVAKLERECQERMDRTVLAVDVQVDDMRRHREQLEKDLEKQHMNVELIREEKLRQKKVFDEELTERDSRNQTLKEAVVAKDERLGTLEMDLLRQLRKYEQTNERLQHVEQDMENATKLHERRIQELSELLSHEKRSFEEQSMAAREKERRLTERIVSLESMVDGMKQDHDMAIQRFVADVQMYMEGRLQDERKK